MNGFYITIPEHWTPQQAEWAQTLLYRLEVAIWNTYEDAIIAFHEARQLSLDLEDDLDVDCQDPSDVAPAPAPDDAPPGPDFTDDDIPF